MGHWCPVSLVAEFSSYSKWQPERWQVVMHNSGPWCPENLIIEIFFWLALEWWKSIFAVTPYSEQSASDVGLPVSTY